MVEKSKDKRLEEKEKLEAELERSLAVAKVKAAHKQIEDTEKSRKRPIALSICKRIETFVTIIMPMIDTLYKPEFRIDRSGHSFRGVHAAEGFQLRRGRVL